MSDSLDVGSPYPIGFVADTGTGTPNFLSQSSIWMMPEIAPVSWPKSMPPRDEKATMAIPTALLLCALLPIAGPGALDPPGIVYVRVKPDGVCDVVWE